MPKQSFDPLAHDLQELLQSRLVERKTIRSYLLGNPLSRYAFLKETTFESGDGSALTWYSHNFRQKKSRYRGCLVRFMEDSIWVDFDKGTRW
jgi:hypothetical protein